MANFSGYPCRRDSPTIILQERATSEIQGQHSTHGNRSTCSRRDCRCRTSPATPRTAARAATPPGAPDCTRLSTPRTAPGRDRRIGARTESEQSVTCSPACSIWKTQHLQEVLKNIRYNWHRRSGVFPSTSRLRCRTPMAIFVND